MLKHPIYLIALIFLLALATRAMTAESLTVRISPHGLEFHAEGSQK